jgi:phosphoribosylaminoimidazolecarboxamide formyltransferase / IMP cyclohydrolase
MVMGSKTALLSVTDKSSLVGFAKGLIKMGWILLSTGGTAKTLREAGLHVQDVSERTEMAEMLSGRVKTLHPKIHGGILYDREMHRDEAAKFGIAPIDMVVVNLYDFEGKGVGQAPDEAIQHIDIGGPAMLRAAAKNHRWCAPVVDPQDYAKILEELTRDGNLSQATRLRLAAKTFAVVSRYDSLIAREMARELAPELSGATDASGESPLPSKLPNELSLQLVQKRPLRYGENPHQAGGFYAVTGLTGQSEAGLAACEVLQGKELSWNNILDLDAALQLVMDLPEGGLAIIKHGNPCGVASGNEASGEVFAKALRADPVSAFGGIVASTLPIDGATARRMSEIFLEVVAAPAFDAAAVEIFSKKKNLRLVKTGPLGHAELLRDSGITLRSVWGGVLVQERDQQRPEPASWQVVTRIKPDQEQTRDLAFAEACAKHVKSNAVVFARDGQTLAIGAGQMSRVDSVRIAIDKARALGHELRGSVVASDAFFPFRDNIDLLAEAGVAAVVQPGGSVRDDEVKAAADEAGMAMVMSGIRHFRH